jgi:hypothetical protein
MGVSASGKTYQPSLLVSVVSKGLAENWAQV